MQQGLPQRQPAAGFMVLPNELIFRIISQTRPSGFQNILLACKRIYEVGQSLIPDHKFCTKWADIYEALGEMGMWTSPLLILPRILSAPSNVQQWLLLYIRQLTITRDWYLVKPHECSQVLSRASSDAPWLSAQLARLRHEYPELEATLEIEDPVTTKIDLGPNHPLYHEDSDDEYYDPDYRYDYSHVTKGPNPTYYHMSTLFRILNLRRLSMSAIPEIRGPDVGEYLVYPLQWFFQRDHGQTLFQELEQLKLQDNTFLSMDDLVRWAMLPRLKALRADGVIYEPEQEEWTAKGSAMQHNSSLEHLIMLRSFVPTDLIAPFLKQLCSLKTFVWEDCLKEINTNRDDVDGIRRNALQGRTLSFNPRELVCHLSLSHSNTIEKLVLATHTDAEEYIPQNNRIEHFKEFKKLTYLEFDLRLLQSKEDPNLECQPHYQSFTEILSPSIEIVHVNIRHGYFQTISRLLEDITAQRDNFPTLRQISICFAEHGAPNDTMAKIVPLRAEIEAVGIKLEMIEMTKLEMQEDLKISIDQHLSKDDMRWFFDMTRIYENPVYS